MAEVNQPPETATQQSPTALPDNNEPRYGGFTRFEIELEFVQTLASPTYLNFLASQKYLEQPSFIAYLNYLLYFTKPPYLQFLNYPGPTIRHLELLQEESFRVAIMSPDVMTLLAGEGRKMAVEWAEGR